MSESKLKGFQPTMAVTMTRNNVTSRQGFSSCHLGCCQGVITETDIYTANYHTNIFTLKLTEILCSNLVRELGNFYVDFTLTRARTRRARNVFSMFTLGKCSQCLSRLSHKHSRVPNQLDSVNSILK